jgi:hypothetical protein
MTNEQIKRAAYLVEIIERLENVLKPRGHHEDCGPTIVLLARAQYATREYQMNRDSDDRETYVINHNHLLEAVAKSLEEFKNDLRILRLT